MFHWLVEYEGGFFRNSFCEEASIKIKPRNSVTMRKSSFKHAFLIMQGAFFHQTVRGQ